MSDNESTGAGKHRGDRRRPGQFRLPGPVGLKIPGWKHLMRTTGTLAPRYLRHPARQDWTVHAVQPGVDLVSFWLDQKIGGGGTGPCISMYVDGYEVLRFDCFGGRAGHFHITPFTPWPVRRRRLEFREQSVREQLERSLFELTHNLDFYLQLNPRPRVRRRRIDPGRLTAACDEVRGRMLSRLETIAVLAALP